MPEPPLVWLVNDGVGWMLVAQNTEAELVASLGFEMDGDNIKCSRFG